MEYVALLGLGVALGVCLAWFMSDWVRIKTIKKSIVEGDLEKFEEWLEDMEVSLNQVWSRLSTVEERLKALEEGGDE